MEELIKYMKALVLLGVAAAQQNAEATGTNPKLEVLLADAGFAHKDIADILAKSPAAVAKAVSRARQTRRSNAAAESAVVGEPNG